MMFSAAFNLAAFVGRAGSAFSPGFNLLAFAGGQYVGPVSAQALLLAGADAVVVGDRLAIDGRWLIGPAGKVYSFSSAASALMWAEINRQRGAREAELMAGLEPARAAVYRDRKRAALAVVAARVVNAAARAKDAAIAAALIAESDFLLSKWG